MAQVKDLLLHHHKTVLPDYSRWGLNFCSTFRIKLGWTLILAAKLSFRCRLRCKVTFLEPYLDFVFTFFFNHFLSFLRIPPMLESLQTLNKEFNKTRQDVDELKAAFSSFKGLLRKLSSGQNVSHTSGVIIRRIRKKKPVINIRTDISRRIRKKKPVIKTGPVIQNQPRKKVRIPRLRARLPTGKVPKNSSPPMCNYVSVYLPYFFIIFTLAFS